MDKPKRALNLTKYLSKLCEQYAHNPYIYIHMHIHIHKSYITIPKHIWPDVIIYDHIRPCMIIYDHI